MYPLWSLSPNCYLMMLDSFAKDLMLDSVAKDPMLDWAANQDVKLDTCQSLLGAGICSNQRGFLPALGFSSPTSSSHHPCKPPLQVFISGAAEWSDSFLSLFNSTDVLSTGLKTCLR